MHEFSSRSDAAMNITSAPEADGSYTTHRDTVCAVMTADCLPLLLCDDAGTRVAAIHVGWRGLCAGIIEAAINSITTRPATLIAWLGPAIGPGAFEVGKEVRAAFITHDIQAKSAFAPSMNGCWMADIYSLARQRLLMTGVSKIHGGRFCTFSEPDLFYSYRRNHSTGRMASLIWLR